MSRKVIWALLILTLCVIVFIFNRGSMSVNVLFAEISALKSLVMFVFLALGVVVGLLLK
jgi:hypothetical protein